jgi:hypothetical protein
MHVDWSHVENDLIVRDLPPVDPAARAEDAAFRHGLALSEGQAKLLGRDVQVSLRERPGVTGYSRGILASGRESSSSAACGVVLGELEKSLGPSATSHDLSTLWADATVTKRRAQWTFGATRVGFYCFILSLKDRTEVSGAWYLFGWHRSVEPEDTNLTWIRCAVKMKDKDGTTRRHLPEMILAIDEYDGELLGENMSRIAEAATVTTKRITFSISDEDSGMKREGSISRATGTTKSE